MIAVDNVIINGENLGEIVCSIYSKDCKSKVEFKNGKPTLNFDVTLTLHLLAQNKIIKQWEKNGRESNEVILPVITAFEEKIKSIIKSGVEKTKELDCDSFLIENKFYRFKSKEYKQYKKSNADFLKDVEVSVSAKVSFK